MISTDNYLLMATKLSYEINYLTCP